MRVLDKRPSLPSVSLDSQGALRISERRSNPRVLYTGTERQISFEWSGDFCNQHLCPNSTRKSGSASPPALFRFNCLASLRRRWGPLLFSGPCRASDGCLAPQLGAETPPSQEGVAAARARGRARAAAGVALSPQRTPLVRVRTPSRAGSDPASPEGFVLGPRPREASPAPWAAGASEKVLITSLLGPPGWRAAAWATSAHCSPHFLFGVCPQILGELPKSGVIGGQKLFSSRSGQPVLLPSLLP